ncbi:hypothetical protein BN7_2707 [Wickerhamomyces ciferrii]|uniref:[histone H3]-dimethyl-L-lysine(36) demethylase n=1 Tax=Wickerhamomyces ciferrii (strain ATCC 14091 / BCRC 22168 / CBS 111 / JCM 3599 / NBRC 0793 / NRRL Y-1031 F-60-10) TaxID=1206466 RepID=K0KDG8_WICCF|nr:uncharacterized protein BN7_2707 [Wickerhamomyces ciferrii]CCH43160.1 hypothetical protein BN7_2707 [Wickerhamomyces ciferrii]
MTDEECPECPNYQKPIPSHSLKISTYHCVNCSQIYGPSLWKRISKRQKRKIDYVALDKGDVDRINLEEHPHIQEFKNWKNDTEVQVIKGSELLSKGGDHGFLNPVKIIASEKDDTGLYIPHEFSLNLLINQLGEDYPIEIMDVLTQNSISPSWSLVEWIDYFQNTSPQDRERILNVLSLEISHCEIGQQIQRPKFVDSVDLVDLVWPQETDLPKPKVSKYCLMGIKNSYTDFHLDFAGTSVYYTILKGSKQFIFFPPTDLNLKKYVNWLNDDKLQNEFLGNLGLEGGIKVELCQGEVLIIPSGWIHGVFTPEDSIVIGGNFLTSFNLVEQFKIIDVEFRTGVDKKFKFPDFDKLMWFTCLAFIQSDDDIKLGDKPSINLELIQAKALQKWIHKQFQLHQNGDLKTKRCIKDNYPQRIIGFKMDELISKFDERVKIIEEQDDKEILMIDDDKNGIKNGIKNES